MKIKPAQLNQLADLIVESYRAKSLARFNGSEAEIKTMIVSILRQNFAEEEAIEEEARTMLALHAQSAKEMDALKMFLLAKQKLAARKGFIL